MTQAIDIILKGGIVMIPLLACSLISLALTIERLIFWARIRSQQAVQHMLTLVETGEFDRALKLRRDSHHPIARVMAAGLAHPQSRTGQSDGSRSPGANPSAQKPAWHPRYHRHPGSPARASRNGCRHDRIIQHHVRAGMGQPHAVTGGVAEALIATASGLLIAILTLIPYNYFSMRVEKEMDAMEHFSSSLELLLHEQSGKY